jgi:hypothetical protein
MLRRFSGWHEPIAAIAESAEEGAILRNDVYYLKPLPRRSEGRVVLVGDTHTRRPGASARARPRRSRMPSCSPTGSQPAATSRPRSAGTRRSGGRGRRPCSSSPVAPTRPSSSRAAGDSDRPPAARTGSAPPAGAARSLQAVTRSPARCRRPCLHAQHRCFRIGRRIAGLPQGGNSPSPSYVAGAPLGEHPDLGR